MTQPITEDTIHVVQDNNDNSNWTVRIDVNSEDAGMALDLRRQVLEGLKALEELEKLKPICDNASKIIIEKIQENQKLKERIKELEKNV